MAEHDEDPRKAFPFRSNNYLLLAIAVGVIILGFLLMVGGGDDDPNKFNGEELFSFRRITLAPITILLGYALVMVAILKKPSDNSREEEIQDKEDENA